jgi:hypothetical protein
MKLSGSGNTLFFSMQANKAPMAIAPHPIPIDAAIALGICGVIRMRELGPPPLPGRGVNVLDAVNLCDGLKVFVAVGLL